MRWKLLVCWVRFADEDTEENSLQGYLAADLGFAFRVLDLWYGGILRIFGD